MLVASGRQRQKGQKVGTRKRCDLNNLARAQLHQEGRWTYRLRPGTEGGNLGKGKKGQEGLTLQQRGVDNGPDHIRKGTDFRRRGKQGPGLEEDDAA